MARSIKSFPRRQTISQEERDYLHSLDRTELMKKKIKYLRQQDYFMASYISRLMVLKSGHRVVYVEDEE